MDNKVNVILPMRAGSQRVINKNTRLINGRPLYEHIISTLVKCKNVNKIIINTDIKEVIDKYNEDERFIMLERPENLRDNCSMNLVIDDTLNKVEGDNFIQLHATSPLLTKETIDKSIQTYFDNLDRNDSLFSVLILQKRVFDKDKKPINHRLEDPPTTQDLDPWYIEDCILYVFSRDSFNKKKHRIGATPYLFPIHPKEAVDIDNEEEFELAELMLIAKSLSSHLAA